MLRQVYLENFVRFKEKHQLRFENGAHFFVGANDSGKSSFFEAIRRCLSISKSTTLSSSFDDTKASVVLSIFETNDKYNIVSAIFGLPSKTKDDKVYAKLAFRSDDEVIKIDFVKKGEGLSIKKRKAETEDRNFEELILKNLREINERSKLTDKPDSKDDQIWTQIKNVQEKVEAITKSDKFKDDQFSVENETVTCAILKELDECVVNTFPNRGIGPRQWSQSLLEKNENVESRESRLEKNEKEKARKSNNSPEDRAEILRWYINEKKMKEDEKKNEQKYYNIITDNCGFNFKKKGNKLICINESQSKDEANEISLLKVPEGLLEAKHCSILCAVSRFSTIILEDPEKGMHPQMISRMCELVFHRITNKVILVSSHHPSFISYKTIQNVFLMRPVISKTEKYSKILRVGHVVADEKKNKTTEIDKTRLTNTVFRNILYAENVLLVEGLTDLLFMESLKDCLLQAKYDVMKGLLGVDSSSSDVDKFKSSLSTLVIMPVEGKGGIIPYLNICNKLKINAAGLEDKDVKESGVEFEKSRFKWDVGDDRGVADLEDVFIELANCELKTERGKQVKELLKKVMKYGEEDDGSIRKDGKFGQTGSRRNIDDLLEFALEVIKDKNEKVFDPDNPCGQLRNLVVFLRRFLTQNNQ